MYRIKDENFVDGSVVNLIVYQKSFSDHQDPSSVVYFNYFRCYIGTCILN